MSILVCPHNISPLLPPQKKNKSNFIWGKTPKGRFSWWLGPPGDPGSLRLHSDLRPDVELDRGGDDGEIEGFLAVKVIQIGIDE